VLSLCLSRAPPHTHTPLVIHGRTLPFWHPSNACENVSLTDWHARLLCVHTRAEADEALARKEKADADAAVQEAARKTGTIIWGIKKEEDEAAVEAADAAAEAASAAEAAAAKAKAVEEAAKPKLFQPRRSATEGPARVNTKVAIRAASSCLLQRPRRGGFPLFVAALFPLACAAALALCAAKECL